MILNERQYRGSQRQLRETEENIRQLIGGAGALAADDRQAATESLQAFARQVRDEIAEYEALKAGTTPVLTIGDLRELPLALIRARIAGQLTQAQLAERLGMKEQQLQRYEITRYAGASLERLTEVALALGLKIEGSATMDVPETKHEAVWRKPLILMMLDALQTRWNRPARSLLELQKFLLNTDSNLRTRLGFHAFEFEPYKFGPYDPFLEDEVESLAAGKFIEKQIDMVATSGDQVLMVEVRTVPLSRTARAHAWLADFEHNDKVVSATIKVQVRQIVDAVATDYGGLSTRDLMARTYAEHPEMTTRSEIRDEMARRAEQKGW